MSHKKCVTASLSFASLLFSPSFSSLLGKMISSALDPGMIGLMMRQKPVKWEKEEEQAGVIVCLLKECVCVLQNQSSLITCWRTGNSIYFDDSSVVAFLSSSLVFRYFNSISCSHEWFTCDEMLSLVTCPSLTHRPDTKTLFVGLCLRRLFATKFCFPRPTLSRCQC